ncbi:MAG: spore coat protein [Oscillospiraceae bacterium]|nr:spore coat protein [Oscillospiraceae bacterium]
MPTNKKALPPKKAMPKRPTPAPKAPPQMGAKEMLEDCLSSEKNLTSVYNTFTNECVNPKIRTDFMNSLRETHEIQADLFNQMQTRGWYAVKSARQPDIKAAAQKYNAMNG